MPLGPDPQIAPFQVHVWTSKCGRYMHYEIWNVLEGTRDCHMRRCIVDDRKLWPSNQRSTRTPQYVRREAEFDCAYANMRHLEHLERLGYRLHSNNSALHLAAKANYQRMFGTMKASQ